MIRGTWVWDRETQKLVPKAEYQARRESMRSDFPTPMLGKIQVDLVNPCDGKHYETYQNYMNQIPKGNHIIEQGETQPEDGRAKEYVPDYREITASVATAYDQVEAGYKSDDHYKSEREFNDV